MYSPAKGSFRRKFNVRYGQCGSREKQKLDKFRIEIEKILGDTKETEHLKFYNRELWLSPRFGVAAGASG